MPHERAVAQALADPQLDMVQFERDQDPRCGAHRLHPLGGDHNDLAGHRDHPTAGDAGDGVVSGRALVMTVGVYGLVAGIVKLDDLGLWLSRRDGAAPAAAGAALLRALHRG
jgi:hypothetical protein